MKYQTISLCMIVKNEERSLDRCLESVKDIVDEIIVVDTGSTDQTLAISRRYTTNIFNYEWNNNFSDARNFAIQHATCDYILVLDADEYLDDNSKDLLNEALTKDYYFLRLRNLIKPAVVYTHSFIRLFSNTIGFKYRGALHEQIDLSDFPGTEGEILPVFINHDGYQDEIIRSKDKNERNMKIIQGELKNNPTPFGYYNLGIQYKSIHEYDKAIKAFRKSYEMNSNTTFAPNLIINLTQCLIKLKSYSEAIKILKDSLTVFPTYTDIFYQLGVLFYDMGYLKDAELLLIKCLELGEVTNDLLSSVEGVGSYLAHAYLAEIYVRFNQQEKARDHIIKGLNQNRLHPASLRIFFDLFLNANPEDVLLHLQSIYPLESADEANILMQSLYLNRNPLFLQLSKFIINKFDDNLGAWVMQVEGNLESAKTTWLSCTSIKDGSQRDILFVAVVEEDVTFFEKCIVHFNLREKDKQILVKLIKRESIADADLNDDLKLFYINLCHDLLMLRKYDVIEYMVTQVQVPMLRYELSKMLFKFQFYELALQVIVEPNNNDDKAIVYELTGDILTIMQNYGDGYQYYLQTEHINSRFELLYKIYSIATVVGDRTIQKEYLRRMNALKLRSDWARKKLNDFNY